MVGLGHEPGRVIQVAGCGPIIGCELGDALVRARSAYQKVSDYDETLFGEDFSTE